VLAFGTVDSFLLVADYTQGKSHKSRRDKCCRTMAFRYSYVQEWRWTNCNFTDCLGIGDVIFPESDECNVHWNFGVIDASLLGAENSR